MRIVGIKVGSRSALTAKRDGTVIWNPPIDVPTHNFPWSNVAPNNRVQTKSDLTIRLRSSTTIDATTLLATITNTRHRGTVLEGPIYNVDNGFWWYRILWDDDSLPNLPVNQGCWVGADNLETAVENAVPVATPQLGLTATIGVGKAITLAATDADNDPLTYTVTALPSNGTLVDSNDAAVVVGAELPSAVLTYTPSETGIDEFSFVANDGTVDSAPAKVILSNAAAPQPGTIPTRIPSFGPNGTHWPGQLTGLETPYMYDETVPHRIEVACNFPAIRSAIEALTAQQVSEGVLLLVQPGTLASFGGGNSSTSALYGYGDKTWTKRITIAPRDGWGSVVISGGGGLKFTQIRNICFAGFPIDGSLRIISSTRFAFARCTVTGYINVLANMSQETEYRQYEFVELVKPNVRLVPDDVMQLQVPQSGATDHVWETIMDGCYFAPNYLPVASSAHQDTIQHLGAGGIWGFKGGTIQDTVVFCSGHTAVNGGLVDTMVRHCWINSVPDNQTPRYPIADGYEMDSITSVTNGSFDNLMFDGGYAMGALRGNQTRSATPYGTVMGGATINYEPSGYYAPTSGAWIVDPTLDGHTNPGYPPLPDDAYLNSIWS